MLRGSAKEGEGAACGEERRAQPARVLLETYVTKALGLAQSSLQALTVILIKHKPKATASPVRN